MQVENKIFLSCCSYENMNHIVFFELAQNTMLEKNHWLKQVAKCETWFV